MTLTLATSESSQLYIHTYIHACIKVAASENTTQITQHDHFFVESNYARQLNLCRRKRQSRRCKPQRIHVMNLYSDSVYVSWAEYGFDNRILFYWLGCFDWNLFLYNVSKKISCTRYQIIMKSLTQGRAC